MDNRTIFTKTAKGLGEAGGKTRALSRHLRNVLKEIDGDATLGELQQKLGKPEGELHAALSTLCAGDYIREYVPQGASANDADFGLTLTGAIEEAGEASVEYLQEVIRLDREARRKEELERNSQEEQQARLEAEEMTRREAEAQARREAGEKARTDAAEKARREAEARAKKEEEERAHREAKLQARRKAEEHARQEAEEKARKDAAEKARREAEARAKKEAEERARLEAEMVARRRAEEQARRKAEEQARKDAEEKTRREAEAQARKEAEERARQKAELLARRQAEEQARKEADENARREAEAQARKEAEERARQKAELLARRKAEEHARKAAAEQARREAAALAEKEAEERERQEAEQLARRMAEERARKEAAEKARREAEARAKQEAEERERQEAERLAREAEEQAKKEAAEKARREAEALAKKAAEEHARQEAERLARLEAEERARQEAAENARREAEALAKKEAEERARIEAEQLARREAEDKARKEAAEKAQREAEAQAKKEAEERARKEAELLARCEAEAQAKKEAEERARHEADLLARRKAEERAARDAEKKLRKEAAEQAHREAVERRRKEAEARALRKAEERTRREEERRARREEDRLRHEADTRRKTEEAEGARHRARERSPTLSIGLPSGWGKRIVQGLLSLALIGVAALHVIPFDDTARLIEKSATEQFRQPVKIDKVHLSLLPRPHWRLENVSVGKDGQIRVPDVNAVIDLGSVFSDRMAFKSIELARPVVSEEGLGWLVFGRGNAAALNVGHIGATDVRVDSRALDLFPFDAHVDIGPDGGWQKMVLDSAVNKMHAELRPDGDAVQLDLNADLFKVPFGSALTLAKFNASGKVRHNEFALSAFSGALYNGFVTGNAVLTWDKAWTLQGELEAKGIDAAQIVPALLRRGKLEGSMSYSLQSQESSKLFASSRLDGRFAVHDGVLLGVDLASLLKNRNIGSSFVFTDLNGIFSYDKGRTKLSRMALEAGMVSATGSAEMDAERNLGGHMAVELRSSVRQMRGYLAVSGKLHEPRFRRAG